MPGGAWRCRTLASVTVLLLAVAGCSSDAGDETSSGAAPATSSAPSSTAPTADLLQYSHDAARGQVQVYVANPGDAPLDPTAIVYDDPRLGGPIAAERVREVPAGSQRGFPVPLPAVPACDLQGASVAPTLTLTTAAGTRSVAATDSTDVVERFLAARCVELAADEVATLAWAPALERTGSGTSLTARMLLVATPAGGGGELTVTSVTGTHLFAVDPPDAAGWGAGVPLRGTGEQQTVALPVHPARCDAHAFVEGGNGTAFVVHVRVGDREGAFQLRMTPAQTADAIAFAQEACGLAPPSSTSS